MNRGLPSTTARSYPLGMDANERRSPIPTVSHLSPDGRLIELVYNADERTTALAVNRPDGSIAIEPYVDLSTDERLVPYSATNNLIATGCVLLPSAVGAFVSARRVC